MNKWGPITKESAESYSPCIICGGKFLEGHEITLLPLGPASVEDREKMVLSKAYNAKASVVHYGCYEALERMGK